MRGWGSRRDANLRSRAQLMESRIRLAQQALAEFREHFMPAAMAMPINEVTELMFYLERAEAALSSGEGGAK